MLAELEPYTEYPPLFPILLAINFIFFGFNEFSLKFFQYMQIFLLSLAIGNLCFRLKMSLLMIFLIIIVFYINSASLLVFQYFWTEPLFTLFIVLLAITKTLRYNYKPLLYSTLLSFLIFLSIMIKSMGFLLVIPYIFSLDKRIFFRNLYSTLIGFLLASVWFIFNKIRIGGISRSHGLFETIYFERILIPFNWIGKEFINPNIKNSLGIIILLFVLFILLSPNIKLFLKGKFSKITLENYYTFNLFWLSLFWGMLGLSLVANFNDLGSRLLFPSVIFFTISYAYTIDKLSKNLFIKTLFMFIFLILISHFSFNLLNKDFGKKIEMSQFEKHRRIWININNIIEVKKFNLFFTDYDFIHQMFNKIPHRIIYDKNFLSDCDNLNDLFLDKSFVLFNQNSEINKIFQDKKNECGVSLSEHHIDIYYLAYKINSEKLK